jgi:hypothetical protein
VPFNPFMLCERLTDPARLQDGVHRRAEARRPAGPGPHPPGPHGHAKRDAAALTVDDPGVNEGGAVPTHPRGGVIYEALASGASVNGRSRSWRAAA